MWDGRGLGDRMTSLMLKIRPQQAESMCAEPVAYLGKLSPEAKVRRLLGARMMK